MLQVGITGGIGSGKSTVAFIFKILGIPILKSDDIAKQLMNEDEILKKEIIKLFGNDIYQHGVLNRKKLADIVFNDTISLHALNELVHPATIDYSNRWAQQQVAPYVIKEAALIFESGSFKELNKVIGVSSPLKVRIERTVLRDSITEATVRLRMDKQMDDKEKMNRCDYVVINDDKTALIPQVLAIHTELLSISKTIS